MRIRPRHIVVLVTGALAVFILYAASLRTPDHHPERYDNGLAPPMDVPIEEAPHIELETNHLDMGIIPHDRDSEATVTIYNRGGNTLEVRDVASSCPLCTRGFLEPGASRISPGGNTSLKVVVSPAGIVGFHSIKTLTLSSNDPRTPQVALRVEAHVDPEFTLEPEDFAFGDVPKGEESQRIVRVRSQVTPPVAIEGVSLDREKPDQDERAAIVFTVEEVEEAQWREPGQKEYDITATLAPHKRSGPFELPVFIYIDLERFSRYRVTAHGTVIAPYDVELEDTVTTFVLRGGDPRVITVRSDAPITVRNAHAEEASVVLQVHRDAPGLYRLRCVTAETLTRGIHHDHILFDVEVDGVTYTERIPVSIYAHGPS